MNQQAEPRMRHDNPMVGEAMRFLGYQDEEEQRLARHATLLADEFADALRIDCRFAVSTPGFGEAKAATPAWEVVQDLFASTGGDAILVDLVTLLGQRMVAGDKLAASVGARLVKAHVAVHVGDAL